MDTCKTCRWWGSTLNWAACCIDETPFGDCHHPLVGHLSNQSTINASCECYDNSLKEEPRKVNHLNTGADFGCIHHEQTDDK